MDKYFKRKSMDVDVDVERNVRDKSDKINVDVGEVGDVGGVQKVDVANLIADPGLRVPIQNYEVNDRNVIRRAYMQMGPCQPRNHVFPSTRMSNKERRFCVSWYDEHPTWLEYSVSKDAVFCFYCYLFNLSGGSFLNNGFSNWKKKECLKKHVGTSSSAHNQARVKYESFKQLHQARTDYRIRLNASIDCVRFLLRQGLTLCGHDESKDSNNQGNFPELLHWLCDHNAEIKVAALTNAPENFKLTSSQMQKDIVSAIASECLNVIMKDVRDSFFSILVDESRDISVKEQMSVVIRYVKNGHVLEHFVGVRHVSSTTAISLKAAIDQLFSENSLSISNLRGQGYDGASNMQGEYNGLRALILKENPSAYYIHCFAHQLHLALVVVAQKHPDIEAFFTTVHILVNVVGGSAKQGDLIRENQRLKVLELLRVSELSSGQCLNQEITLQCPGDTPYGSYYSCLTNLIVMFSTIVDIVEMIATDTASTGTREMVSSELELKSHEANCTDSDEEGAVIPRSGGEVVDENEGSNEVLIEELEKKLLEQVVYSEEEAYMLYCDYAQAMGFSIRRGKQFYFMGTKRVRSKSYCCSKEGYKDDKVDALTYKKPETRTGCKAMICFGCDDNGQWKVSRFLKDHNHEMAPAYAKPSLISGQAILTATIYGNGGMSEPSMNEHDRIWELSLQLSIAKNRAATSEKQAATYKRQLDMIFQHI